EVGEPLLRLLACGRELVRARVDGAGRGPVRRHATRRVVRAATRGVVVGRRLLGRLLTHLPGLRVDAALVGEPGTGGVVVGDPTLPGGLIRHFLSSSSTISASTTSSSEEPAGASPSGVPSVVASPDSCSAL